MILPMHERKKLERDILLPGDLMLRLTLPKLSLQMGDAVRRATNEEKHCRKLPPLES